MKNLFIFIFALTLIWGMTSCSDDGPSSTSIFDTSSPTRNEFEEWLLKNYTNPYNIDFKYKMEDIESDKKYTLVPADSAKSAKLAIIVKYLWLESYDEAAGIDFTKSNVPRIINLIGSPAYKSDGTIILGTAEGGLKVTLYCVNNLTDAMLKDFNSLNEYYFHTMHHEFTHILNQKKPYDTAFQLITESSYVGSDWYTESDAVANQSGFVTPYSMSEPFEDFAETLSVYVTSSPTSWNAILANAGTTGAGIIMQKLAYVKSYMQDSWNIDLDELRDIIQRRENNLKTLDLEHFN